MLDVGAMPPKKQTHRPTHAEEDLILAWVGGSLNRYGADHMETGGDTVARRINHRAWRNMIRTLLGVPAQCMDEFPDDGASYGYDTVGSGLYTTVYETEMDMKKAAQQSLDLAIPPGDVPPKVRESKWIAKNAELSRLKDTAGRIDTEILAPCADPSRFGGELLQRGYALLAKSTVAKFYGKKGFEDVGASGIDWAHDSKCTDAILSAMNEESAAEVLPGEGFRVSADAFVRGRDHGPVWAGSHPLDRCDRRR